MPCKFEIGDNVKILNSSCDLQKSTGKNGIVRNIIPTARGDGSIWYNLTVEVLDAHVKVWSLCFLEDHLEKIGEKA